MVPLGRRSSGLPILVPYPYDGSHPYDGSGANNDFAIVHIKRYPWWLGGARSHAGMLHMNVTYRQMGLQTVGAVRF